MIISYTTTYAGLSQAFTVTNARTNVPLFRYYPYMNTEKDVYNERKHNTVDNVQL